MSNRVISMEAIRRWSLQFGNKTARRAEDHPATIRTIIHGLVRFSRLGVIKDVIHVVSVNAEVILAAQ